MKIITQNKKAFHDYDVLERIETGIVLTGDEVKSLRAGHIALGGSFAYIHQGELMLINCSITPYCHAYFKAKGDPTRSRKLLVHKREIIKIIGDISRKGLTLVPIKMYFNGKGKVKVELGLCKHKKAHAQKQELKERDIARETRRELRGKYNY
jgi:SsrA-binding protein